ncbi:LysM peptidoglycan-binding domain-containing protein [Imbroritus primus]|uniref:LysM peptidoglycan-binding domain-containing protein n=1 Tax=Imbroritus primus TaxID=3058603 RepID=A0ACD3SMS6_9BURK|nr:LysM peptidoglycan-binding domain-containing protein [Burkholderiaceae bacterium PBA]
MTTSIRSSRGGLLALTALLSALLAACASSPMPAPVVDRTGRGTTITGAPLAPVQPGFYRVKRGDTLYRIALEHGQSYRDVAAWNNITNPAQIEVDQVLRVAPPGASVASSGVSSMPVTPGTVEARPIDAPPVASGEPAGGSAAASTGLSLSWPVKGPMLARFDDKANKGIDIGGTRGTPILAAADGRVIHVGPLRGYGNLVIIKHDDTYLTAYGNNDQVVVTEQAAVRKGQKIAEMGSSDSDRVKLHFEVRQNGKPIDPMRFLPPQ